MKYEQIPKEKIHCKGERFRISLGKYPKRLFRSVKKLGILNPLWVMPKKEDKSHELVLGYSRFYAACDLGMTPLPCHILEKETSEGDIHLANIYDNLSHRELNPMEQAIALKKSLHYFGREKVISEIMPALGMGKSDHALERALSLLDLAEQIREAVAKDQISLANAYSLLPLSPREQTALFRLFSRLRLGVNLQKEFIENLSECSRRDGIPIYELVQRENLSAILESEKIPEQKKAEGFRAELRRMRYPRLSETESSFEALVRSLGLPPELNIFSPPYFETDIFRVQVRFKNPDELRSHVEKLQKALESPGIKEWFGRHTSH